MKSEQDAQRILALGAAPSRMQVMGSLKWDASLSTRPTREAVREAAARLGVREGEPVIVAGSTHRGEEATLLAAYRRLRDGGTAVRLILAPRHPERAEEVEALIGRAGLRAVRLSRANGSPDWEAAILDIVGQLPCYYGLATAVFIGGSLIPHGGQNPLEATCLAKPVIFGPFMHNFEDIAQPLLAGQAAIRVKDAESLEPALRSLLEGPAAAAAMGRRAQALTERSAGATARAVEALAPLLAARSVPSPASADAQRP